MRKDDAIAIAALFAVITAVFAHVLFGGDCFYVRDLTRYYFPTKKLLHDIVAGGDFPLWNPYYSAGQPAAANPEYEIFYPGQWPIFLRDFFFGYRLHIVLHFYVAAAGMYALLRTLRARPVASAASAIAFVFGGAVVSSINLLPILFALAWLPFTLLFTLRRQYALASLFLCLQILAFEPSVLIDTFALLAAIALWRREVKPLLVIAGGLAAGAVQLIPTLDLLRHTARAHGLAFDMAAYWSMPPSRLVEVIQPHWFGTHPLTGNHWWGGSAYRQASTPYLVSIYTGLVAAVAIVTAAIRRDRRAIAALLAIAGIWIVALGEHTPLLRLLFSTGLPMPLRFPERFALLATFVMVVAGGVALDRILNDAEWRGTAMKVSIALAALFLLIAPLSMHRNDWLASGARAAGFVLILALPRRYAPAIVALVLADLLPLLPELAPTAPRAFFDSPPVASELRRPSDHYRIFFAPEWSSGATAHRYFDDATTLYGVLRDGMFPRTPAAWGFRTVYERNVDQTNLAVSDEVTEAMWKVRQSGRPDWIAPFAAMGNVEYLAAYRPYPNARPTVFVPIGTNPRYWLAETAVSGDAVKSLTAERHSLRTAYVDGPSPRVSPGWLRVIEERADRVRLEVRSDGDAFVVACNTFDPNWRATVDGLPVTLVKTNIAYQGVAVPRGRHVVELVYRNTLITIGACISAATALLLALLASGVGFRNARSVRVSTDPPI